MAIDNSDDWADINYIYILDYSVGSIFEICLTEEDKRENKIEDIEDILYKYNCNIDTCSFMTTTDRINNIITL